MFTFSADLETTNVRVPHKSFQLFFLINMAGHVRKVGSDNFFSCEDIRFADGLTSYFAGKLWVQHLRRALHPTNDILIKSEG